MSKPGLEGFLLGTIASCSLLASLFFFKYWRRTRDSLFLAFGTAFLIEGLNRTAILGIKTPSHGSTVIYSVRLCASLLILAAIVRKNFASGRRQS